MVLLTVISSVQRHDHWFYQRDMLTSYTFQFGMSKSPDFLSEMQGWFPNVEGRELEGGRDPNMKHK